MPSTSTQSSAIDASAPPRAGGARQVACLAIALAWLANSLVGSLIGILYMGDVFDGASIGVRLFAHGALVSSIATVFALPALALVLAALAVPNLRLLGIVQALTWTAALLVLFVDTRVYGIFRYHLNGMVWNLITTPGGQDTVDIGAATFVILGVAAIAVFALEVVVWRRWFTGAFVSAGGRNRRARAVKWGIAALLGVVVIEKATYAYADFRRDREITARASVFPLYQRLTLNRLLSKVLGVDMVARAKVEVSAAGLLLHYPLEAPRIDPKGARPNILIIVLDSLRSDMLAETTMPRISAWSKGARVFADHASGGNATRFGIFSLVYGIHGTYWMPAYEEKAPPVLVTTLQSLGYDMRVISAAGMTYPEFRSTAWVTMEDKVEDDLPAEKKYERDRLVASHFDAWLSDREARREPAPFFCFTLIDSPHQTYTWPPEETVFRPSVDRVDYLKAASRPSDADIVAVRNSFMNAVHFADGVAADMIDALKRRKMLENTIVIVTGDHGEEFWENGFFGHTSNFTREQVHVTFAMSGPGIPAGVETRPTAHVDVAPTLLELLGADPAQRAQWSQGENLLAPLAQRERIVAGWQEVAVWVDGGVLHVPLEGHKGLVEGYTWRWKLHPDGDRFIAAHSRAIAELAVQCRRFLR
jgi:uncharacterized protein